MQTVCAYECNEIHYEVGLGLWLALNVILKYLIYKLCIKSHSGKGCVAHLSRCARLAALAEPNHSRCRSVRLKNQSIMNFEYDDRRNKK